ncbi:extracellular solute-binding protein [Actinokineospora guangxiensis]|uniref:Extracellular solute-binding protein n=1 Tax=Actinokineospora guangxiensis TaxID=1490288 RepID=A0ABW0ESA4_9PSEU
MRKPLLFGATGFALGAAIAVLATQVVWPAVTAPDGREPGALVLMTGTDESIGQQRLALIDQWNAMHPENPVTVKQLPATADAARSQMVAQAQSGEEQVDVYNLDVVLTPEFADAGFITPLEDVDTTGFLAKPLSTCRYRDQLWALPFNTDAGLLFYRTDLVQQQPRTWRQLRNAIRDGKPADMPIGLATQLGDYEGGAVTITEAVQADGGKLVDDGEVVIDSPAAQDALTELAEDVRDADINLAASLEANERSSTQAFGNGEAMFLRNWPIAYRELTGKNIPFGVMELPGPSVLGGQNLAIAARSANKGAARELIEFLTSPRSQQLLFERGGLAATRGIVYQDPTILNEYPYAGSLLKAVEEAEPRPVGPHYTRFSETLRDVVRQMLVEGELPPDYLERLDRAWKGR